MNAISHFQRCQNYAEWLHLFAFKIFRVECFLLKNYVLPSNCGMLKKT